jgi:hypothetical protein
MYRHDDDQPAADHAGRRVSESNAAKNKAPGIKRDGFPYLEAIARIENAYGSRVAAVTFVDSIWTDHDGTPRKSGER